MIAIQLIFELHRSLQGTHACADLPEIGPGKHISGYISWLLLMAVGIPIWAYQGLLGLMASIFACAHTFFFSFDAACKSLASLGGLKRLCFRCLK